MADAPRRISAVVGSATAPPDAAPNTNCWRTGGLRDGGPLLDSEAGAMRVGVWANEVEAEIRRTMAPVILGILAILTGGLVCSIYLVRQINRPIVKLVRMASHISRGELDVPLSGTRDPGKFGELSRALERMRSSVKAAMTRPN